jgi:hypothetical protein
VNCVSTNTTILARYTTKCCVHKLVLPDVSWLLIAEVVTMFKLTVDDAIGFCGVELIAVNKKYTISETLMQYKTLT